MKIKKRNGDLVNLDISKIIKQTIPACEELNLSHEELEIEANISFTDGMRTEDIQKILINTAKSKVDIDAPNWTFVAARLTLYDLYHRTRNLYDASSTKKVYEDITLSDYLTQNVNIIDIADYTKFNIAKLNKAIVPKRDYLFNSPGIETLISRYLIKNEDKIVTELPQHMFMTIAMWLAQHEDNPTSRAIEFYDVLSKLEALPGTPTLANGRLKNRSCFSCFVGSTSDDLTDIFTTYSEQAEISKLGGGIGWDWTKVRAEGAPVQKVSNASGGLVPWLKIENDIAIAVDQLGTRAGAINCSIEVWHKDIQDFLDLKKTSGEERRRAEDLFITVSLPDLFMRRVEANDYWTLFDPYDAPELTDIHNQEFEYRYKTLETTIGENPSYFKNKPIKLKAKDLMKKIIRYYFERGVPFITFKDTVNKHHDNPELGIIRSGNLCVSLDTKILTRGGYVEIGSVLNTVQECWNGESWSNTQLFLTSEKEHVLSVQLSNGETIRATDYHKWYIAKQDKKGKLKSYKEVRTHELKPGDKLIKFDLDTIIHGSKKLKNAYENGFYSADGCKINKKTKAIFLYNNKKDLLNNFKNYKSTNEEKTLNKSKDTRLKLSYDINELQDKFFIPNASYTLKSRLKWLAGLFDGDATLTNNNGTESIQLTSTNIDFINEVKLLLQELGVHSSVKNGYEEGYRFLPNNSNDSLKLYKCNETKRLLVPGSSLNKLLKLGYKANRVMPTKRKYNREAKRFIKVLSIVDNNEYVPVACGTEPERNKLMFNGVLTGNCQEFFNPVTPDEIAVCNLASINLSKVNTKEDFERVIPTIIRILDNVIDLSSYPVQKAKDTQLARRSVGLGVCGEAELIANQQIHYGSQEHFDYIDMLYSSFKQEVDKATFNLADERGAWSPKSKKRNAYTTCIAPTSSIAILMGTSNSCEPVFAKKWHEENMDGNIPFTAPNINPDNYQYYESAYDIDQHKMITATGIRQKYFDMGISHNLYFRPEGLTTKIIYDAIYHAWKSELKSLYYLRSESKQLEDIKSDKIVCFGCEG